MLGLLATVAFAMFAHDNAEFINDMNEKLEQDCSFTYVGKQEVRPDVPHIAVDNKYVYFSMEPCPKGE
jgi:hypothetical protein|tara:strand:+ start:231 stop:434 length:204 start_codon:yes stop_codon:yes gene_type:complete